MTESVRAYVALGANLGDAAATVRAAFGELARLPGSRLAACSGLYRTAPVGLRNQPDFMNAVAALDTALAPETLLAQLFAIEARFGRERRYHHAPRTLDLDLLLHGSCMRETPALTLPHPRMHERAFVLVPLAEIAPDCEIPGCGRVADLLPAVAGQRIEFVEHAPCR